MKNIDKKCEAYFKANPQKEKVYGTSDGFLFEQKQNAVAHSKTLKDTAVKTYSNSVKTTEEVNEIEVDVEEVKPNVSKEAKKQPLTKEKTAKASK